MWIADFPEKLVWKVCTCLVSLGVIQVIRPLGTDRTQCGVGDRIKDETPLHCNVEIRRNGDARRPP
jgi:hypothetical protein